MKKHKIAFFVVFLIIASNIAAQAHGHINLHTHWQAKHKLHICSKDKETENIEMVRILAPKFRYLYFENLLEIVQERKPDIPENYFCVVVEEKNRVQDARRVVEEIEKPNTCSKIS